MYVTYSRVYSMNKLMSPCFAICVCVLLFIVVCFIYVINDKKTQQITVQVTRFLNAKFHPIIFCWKNVYNKL